MMVRTFFAGMQISAPRGNCSSPRFNPRQRAATTSRHTNALSGLSRICLDLRSGSCCLHFTKVLDIMEPSATTTGSRAVAPDWQYVFILAFACPSCCVISSLFFSSGCSRYFGHAEISACSRLFQTGGEVWTSNVHSSSGSEYLDNQLV